MSSYQYRKSHCGDKTILRPSYLHNGISYTGKMIFLYWIRAQVLLTVLILSQFWLSKTGQIWGLWAFPGEHMELPELIRFWSWSMDFLYFGIIWLSETDQFEVSRHFLEHTWREWHEIWQADVSWPPSELIRFWSWCVDFPPVAPFCLN